MGRGEQGMDEVRDKDAEQVPKKEEEQGWGLARENYELRSPLQFRG
jgi:hypothetical protein